MKQDTSKKYFVKDTSLHNVDDDMFNYADISKVLGQIIDTNEPPYNVAVIGKWGLGKSSLINLVTDVYKNKNQDYLVQEINAWKYEKESLGKVFLKQLWQGISGRKVKSFEVIKREFSDIVNGDIDATPSKSKKAISRKLFLTAGAIALATIVLFSIYKFVQAAILGTEINAIFWGNMFLSYCKNIATVLLFPILIGFCKVLLDDYHAKNTKKIELSFPIETTDDYEIFLEEKIKDHLEKAPNLKVITIIDDLDRLSIDKIVEALDALKAFVGFERCIFIVPFDDEIIKLALDKRRARIFNDKDDIVESELILDKLFQFKIYLPPLLSFDIKKYATDLVKQEIPDFLTDFCSVSVVQKLIERVIIHSDVTTPRQVKKLINSFINNYMIAYEREASNKVQKGLLTSETGQMQIAKFSVLQADFNQFYDLLFKDIGSIKKILEYHRNAPKYSDIPNYLKDYFYQDDKDNPDEIVFLKQEYEPLINFLIRTDKYKVDSIAPYLYLAQDEISKKTGDEIQRRFLSALISGNIESVKQLISSNPDVTDALTYQLTLDSDELLDTLANSINIFQDVPDDKKLQLAQNIIERTLELAEVDTKFLCESPDENIFALINHFDNDDFARDFLDCYLHVFTHKDWSNSQQVIGALGSSIGHYSELNEKQISTLTSIAKECINSDRVSTHELIPVVPNDNPTAFLALFGLDWYKNICAYIESESDFSTTTLSSFMKSFGHLVNHVDINTLIEIMTPLTAYAAFLPTLNAILDRKASFTDKNNEVIERSIREGLSAKHSTKLANNLMGLDFDKNIENIHSAINGLHYQVNADNKDIFDAFTSNFTKSSLLDDILVYCGEKGYFQFLSDTIDDIEITIFNGSDGDELFKKVQAYYTNEQRIKLLDKLKSSSVYANKSFEREIAIYEMLALNDENKESLNEIVKATLIPQLNSYHNQPPYFEFISRVMGNIKNAISQESVDLYANALISRFNSYSSASLTALNRIAGKMSATAFKSLFPYLMGVSPVDFEAAVDVLINNDNLRPRESADLTSYRTFLVDNLKTANNPNKVMDTISSAFSYISNLQEMVSNALDNSNTDIAKLTKLIGKTFNAEKIDVNRASKEIIEILTLEDTCDLIIASVKMITAHGITDILTSIVEQIDENTSIDALLCLMSLSEQFSTSSASVDVLFKSLQLSFEHVNQSDKILSAVRIINNCKALIAPRKTEIVTILYTGFHSTTSDKIKESILHLISSLKLKPQFKKLLDETDLKYYKNWSE